MAFEDINLIRFSAICLISLTTILNLEGSQVGSASSAIIYDIRINPLYNLERKKIIFKVSWSKAPSLTIFSYKFKLMPNCSNSHFETPTFENYNLTEILIPPLLNSHQILLACVYEIKITTALENGKEKDFTYVYTVPECVGPKCSCKYFTARFKNFGAYEFSPGKLNVTWDTQTNGYNATVGQITSKMLEYRFLKTNMHANPFKRIPVPYNTTNNFILLNETSFLITNVQYELRAIFNNSFNCKMYDYTNITMRRISSEEQSPEDSKLLTMLYVVSAVILFLFTIYFLRRNRLLLKKIIKNPRSALKRHARLETGNSYLPISTINKVDNILYVPKEIIEDRYEFHRSKLHFGKKIGSGAFGQVFLAEAYGIDNPENITNVAVKKLNEGAPVEEMDGFLSEIDILKKIGQHPNVVRIFGCCTLEKPYLMIMEYVPCGDLLHHLIDLREKWQTKIFSSDASSVFTDVSDGAYIVPDNSSSISSLQDRSSVIENYTPISDSAESTTNKIKGSLSHTELQQFALQIARGMEHLEKIPIAHRDLAARNILINERKILKISDFGLSRMGPYVNSKSKKMPLRWVAIEAIEDHFYDSKGDVWSFAVVLWEIGTLGAFPYENIDDRDVCHYLASGKRLSRPEVCTDELYSLMLKCWSRDPKLRPSFDELVQILDAKRRLIYVDFSQLNPLYVFPPQNCNENGNRS